MFKSKPVRTKKAKPAPKKSRGPRGEGSVFLDKPPRRVARQGAGRAVPQRRHAVRRGVGVDPGGGGRGEEDRQAARPGHHRRPVGRPLARALSRARPHSTTTGNTVKWYIKPTLGHLRVTAVTAGDVERALKLWGDARAEHPQEGHGPARPCSARRGRSGLIAANLVADARPRRASGSTARLAALADLRRVIAAANDLYDRPYRCLAAIGCRSGELVAARRGRLRPGRAHDQHHQDVHPQAPDPRAEDGGRRRTARPVPAQARPAVLAAIGNSGGLARCSPTPAAGGGTTARSSALREALLERPRPRAARDAPGSALGRHPRDRRRGPHRRRRARPRGHGRDHREHVPATPPRGDVCDAMEGLLGGVKVAESAPISHQSPQKARAESGAA